MRMIGEVLGIVMVRLRSLQNGAVNVPRAQYVGAAEK
jgi:hypothetical protein